MYGCLFNIDSGYLEGLCRGFKSGILTQNDYLNLVQCETLEGKVKRSNGPTPAYAYAYALHTLIYPHII
jgi:hypothetical protein